MKEQNLCIICTYTNEEIYIQDIVNSSFTTFLKKELEKFASRASGHV